MLEFKDFMLDFTFVMSLVSFGLSLYGFLKGREDD